MEKTRYTKPQMEVKEIETELFLCESLGVSNTTLIDSDDEILSKEHKSYDLWDEEED